MTQNNNYPIRRSSLITPWGVGSIVPFPNDESLMVSGLDFWFDKEHKYDDFIITDERLSKRLGGKILVAPPDFREKKQDTENTEIKIPAVRFPRWHYCPVCGNMKKIGSAGDRTRCSGDIRKITKKETYCSKNKGKPKVMPKLVPERFIVVCPKGHIDDFPIMEWIHTKSNKLIMDSCELVRSTGGSSASLSGIRYTCTCGATATMNGAFGKGALKNVFGDKFHCTGNRPWLGDNQNVDCKCGDELLVLLRGASNVWFADVISSIYIPSKKMNKHTKECVEKGINKFISSQIDGLIDVDGISGFVHVWQNNVYDDIDVELAIKEIIAAIGKQKEEEKEITDEEYRKEEYDILIKSTTESQNELYVKNYCIDKYDNLWFLNSISLVHKLKETRVFRGFRRINPDGDFRADISIKETSWLPAIENNGEGIMFEFNQEKLKEWAINEKIVNRTKIIEQNLKNSNKLTNEKINPAFILLHTFAHCLINALASESGYSNASIRERIYCNKFIDDNAPQMAGVLIYTASGDSEGSLGGLVRQGLPGRVENIIARAINEARWCAADPVCIQSTGQGQYGCNLAACHNCALLPETSCENKNMYLDRGLMIGTLDDNTIGYFSDYGEN